MRTIYKIISLSMFCCLSIPLAQANSQLFTKHYELSIPDDVSYQLVEQPQQQLIDGIKDAITVIVNESDQLKLFPIKPESVLDKIQFQPPITTAAINGAEIVIFTVNVPVPDPIRNLLIRIFFNADIFLTTADGHHLRLHKEPGGPTSDVGIIIVKAQQYDDLNQPQIDAMIRSFGTY